MTTWTCFCDSQPPEFSRRTQPRARRQHKCTECDRAILPGETYERTVGRWDGEFCVFVTCEHCYDARQFMVNSLPCFCWSHGSLHEEIRETLREVRWHVGEEVAGLAFAVGRIEVRRRRLVASRRNPPSQVAAHPAG